MTYPRALTAQLLDTDGTTVVAGTPLAKAFDLSFLDELNGPGSGSASLPLSEAGATELTPGRFVQILVAGTARFTFEIEGDPDYKQIQRGEAAEEVITVTGRGWGCQLDKTIVEPEDLDLNLDASWRLFSFASPTFPNAGSWVAADELYEYLDGVTYGARFQRAYGEDYPAPIGFPWPTSPNVYDPDSPPGANYVETYWIWDATFEEDEGYGFFRRTMTVPTNGVVTIAVTADNLFTLFLGGVPILGENENSLMWQGYKEVSIFLAAGSYQLAAVVENIQATGIYNPSGFIMNAYYQGTGALPETHIISTDSNWVTTFVAHNDFWPGWTVGQILIELITESIARGSLAALDSYTFAALVDTDSNSWDSTDDDTTTLYVPSYGATIGSTLMQVLNELHEAGWIDWHVQPGSLILDVWAGGQAGSTPGVSFVEGTNIAFLERGETEPYANALLVQWERGYVRVADAAAITAAGTRIEDIHASDAASEAEAERQGRIELDARANAALPAILLGVEPTSAADCPYEAFDVGDYVTVPNTTGGTESVQVLSISVDPDKEGNAVWVMELNRRLFNPSRQEADLLRQIGGRSGYVTGSAR